MLKIVQITDPVCTWCYGNEPQTRAIAFLYDAQCKYLMGGLVEDIRNFYDAHNAIGGTDIAATNAAIIAHWREASARHKMPVTSGAFCLLSEQYPSTWPQNIAYKAAQIAAPEHAEAFLRNMRVATALHGKITSKTDTLVEIASETGMDIAAFINALDSQQVKDAFQQDRQLIAQLGVNGFPASLIQYKDNSVLLKGYQSLENFQAVIKMLGGGSQEAVFNENEIMRYLQKFKKAFLCEIEICFAQSPESCLQLLEQLQAQGKINISKVENTFEICISHAGTCRSGACALTS